MVQIRTEKKDLRTTIVRLMLYSEHSKNVLVPKQVLLKNLAEQAPYGLHFV